MKKSLANNPAHRQSRPRFTLPAKVAGGLTLMSLIAGFGLFASRPAHTAGGPIAVNVANAPLPVVDSESGRTPFQTEITPALVGPGIDSHYQGQFTVPSGKRLVLQTLSAKFSTYVGSPPTPVFAVTTLAGGQAGMHNFTGPLTESLAFPEQSLTVYADPGTSVALRIDNIGSFQSNSVTVTLSGYLVDAP